MTDSAKNGQPLVLVELSRSGGGGWGFSVACADRLETASVGVPRVCGTFIEAHEYCAGDARGIRDARRAGRGRLCSRRPVMTIDDKEKENEEEGFES